MEVKKIVKKGIKYRILLEVGSIDTYEEIILKYNLLSNNFYHVIY